MSITFLLEFFLMEVRILDDLAESARPVHPWHHLLPRRYPRLLFPISSKTSKSLSGIGCLLSLSEWLSKGEEQKLSFNCSFLWWYLQIIPSAGKFPARHSRLSTFFSGLYSLSLIFFLFSFMQRSLGGAHVDKLITTNTTNTMTVLRPALMARRQRAHTNYHFPISALM